MNLFPYLWNTLIRPLFYSDGPPVLTPEIPTTPLLSLLPMAVHSPAQEYASAASTPVLMENLECTEVPKDMW